MLHVCNCCCIMSGCFRVEVIMSAKTLMPAERQKEILERIQKDGRVLATDLAQEFQTSEDTIRRALRESGSSGTMHACVRRRPSHVCSLRFCTSAKEGVRRAEARSVERDGSDGAVRSTPLYRRRFGQPGSGAGPRAEGTV